MSLLHVLGLKPATKAVNMQQNAGIHLDLGKMLANVVIVFDQETDVFSMEVAGDDEYARQAERVYATV